jgi:hypothetical protein
VGQGNLPQKISFGWMGHARGGNELINCDCPSKSDYLHDLEMSSVCLEYVPRSNTSPKMISVFFEKRPSVHYSRGWCKHQTINLTVASILRNWEVGQLKLYCLRMCDRAQGAEISATNSVKTYSFTWKAF